MTDAEVLRVLASEGSCDPYYGHIAPMSAFGVEQKKDTDFDAAREVDAVAKTLFTRAADAIEDLAATRRALDDALESERVAHEENARLRASLSAIVSMTKDNAAGDPDGDALNTLVDIHTIADAALRKPDAGGEHE